MMQGASLILLVDAFVLVCFSFLFLSLTTTERLCWLTCVLLLARVHPLSAYTPICTRCGLILCSLNPPYRACPTCDGPLPMLGLVQKLEEEINQALAEEAAAKTRAEEAAREAAGAFPTLQAPTPSSQALIVPSSAPAPTMRKVMSLSGGGRVKVSTYSPTPSRPHTPSNASTTQEEDQRRRQRREEEERGSRIARPPTKVVTQPQSGKGWGDGLSLGEDVQYVASGNQATSHGKGKKPKRDIPDDNARLDDSKSKRDAPQKVEGSGSGLTK